MIDERRLQPVLSERIAEVARNDFPESELGTALWLLRGCADDADRMGALPGADGDTSLIRPQRTYVADPHCARGC